MRRLEVLIIAGLLLAIMPTIIVLAVPDSGIAVPETSATVVVDGVLNMASEWNGSAVVTWYNPLDGEELDTVYLLHNNTHYLFATVLYDPDPIDDDSFTLHVKWSNITYKYILSEGSSSVELYNVTDGEAALSSNGTAIMTSSSPSQSWIYVELAIPKSEWNSSTTVYALFVHRHTFKIDTTSKYPEAANTSDPSTWLEVRYEKILGQYKVVLTFRDRDNNPIDYVSDRSYAIISFLNGTHYTTLAPAGSSIEILLPPENYTITFYVYGIPIFNTTLNVNTNITTTYTLNNLKHVTTAFGNIVAIAELPGEIGCIYLDPEKHLGVLITNSTKEIALRIYPEVTWNYTFAAVLNALNFTYNPFTKNLLAYAPGNFSGIMMIGAPEDYPVFFFANGTARGYVYNHELEELDAWITNGTYMIYHVKTPFAITLNNIALRKGTDYITDPFNVTTISISNGDLRIYFRNPAEVSLDVASATARITVTSPYHFNGSYTLKIYKGSEIVALIASEFTSSIPLTSIEVPLNLDPGSYRIEVTITDENSKQTIGTASTTYEVAVAPAIPEIGWEYYLLLLVIALLAIAIVVSLRVARHTIEETREKRYVKRKGG
ncbi:MAG: hypothetical protein DRJ60_00025 [Thermoprotei archaeon]|nr:MAG: hypothetical protein DRJ60_00025 [Thermoprotei archaeon]